MSNIRQGTVIYSNENDHKMIYHKSDGHVVAWNRNYSDDGQPLPSWRSCDCGTPEDAIRVFPGLRDSIIRAANE